MGRKKNRDESVSCYYCEKQFDSEDHLIQHQKSKHFKCPICYRRFVNAPAMSVHMKEVHHEELKTVPEALKGKDDPKIEIEGTVGVPLSADEKRRKLEQLADQQQLPMMPFNPMMMPMMYPFPFPNGAVPPMQAGQFPPNMMPGMPNMMPGMPNMMPGMPNMMPGMPNMMPGMPNMMPGMPNMMPGMPNMAPGMPNMMPGMPNMMPGMPNMIPGTMPPIAPNTNMLPPGVEPNPNSNVVIPTENTAENTEATSDRAQVKLGEEVLVFFDEEFSIEERRAQNQYIRKG